jgi:putative ABC transport system ATP-binding protein
MIKTVNLNKVFRTEEIETSALNNVNLHIQKGEFVAIMGPSGCGKSTLLNIIGLLDNPSSGEYYFDNQEVAVLKNATAPCCARETSVLCFRVLT